MAGSGGYLGERRGETYSSERRTQISKADNSHFRLITCMITPPSALGQGNGEVSRWRKTQILMANGTIYRGVSTLVGMRFKTAFLALR
jgi:hypothetical protein